MRICPRDSHALADARNVPNRVRGPWYLRGTHEVRLAYLAPAPLQIDLAQCNDVWIRNFKKNTERERKGS